CKDDVLWRGNTDRDGIATIDKSLGEPRDAERCYEWSPSPLLVTASGGQDFSFALSGWNKGIAPHDFGLQTGSIYEAPIYHTVLDRPLFRAGETVSMKHFLRR